MRQRSAKNSLGISPLAGEWGTIRREAGAVIALGYPAPYRVAACSLGAQTVYRTLNEIPGLACTRFFMPLKGPALQPLVTAETGRPVVEAQAIAFSIACENELIGIVELLHAAGLEPLAQRRDEQDPPIIIGGPLTLVDPYLVSPLADIVVVGEAEEALHVLGKAVVENSRRSDLFKFLEQLHPGIWIPSQQPNPPTPTETPIHLLPAAAATWSGQAEFKNLYLVEATRSCKRGCAFCVMSARADYAQRFRPIPIDHILDFIPEEVPGVGLVGAAVTDHPEIEKLVSTIVESGKRVSLSSIRADRFTKELARMLKKGGLRTLTIAADGSSDRLRKAMHKGISTNDLVRAAELASSVGIRNIKIYSMIGLPKEEDDDVREFADLAVSIGGCITTRVALQAFVPKPGTPLKKEQMADEAVIRRRLDLMKRHVQGRVRLIPTSPRWSRLDWKLAHAGPRAAHAAIAAFRLGGNFSAWRRAIDEVGI
ncbi:MAG: radical SAM protein [Proteobacteria bacterium]|nr:radical SAM protein [Pseudomonadota bacterium]